MPNYNLIVLIGHLTRDAEIKYLPKGTAVLDSCLAVNRMWKKESGEKMEDVTFIEITAFGKICDTIAEYTKKGDPLQVSGYIKQDRWEDKESGQKRSKLKVIV